MRNTERLYRGDIHCTVCKQEGGPLKRNSWNLVRNEDGTYSGYCNDHRPEGIYQDDTLSLVETCLHYPWMDVVSLTLHKLRPDPDRKGKIVTVQMREYQNLPQMKQHAVEVLHGLQLMADNRATVHNFGATGEGNHCWTETNYHWEAPAEGYIRDKYWGEKQIEKFRDVCRVMCRVHEWELVDETMPLLDRIVRAIDKGESE